MRSILFKRSELCYDIANLAFVAADIREGSVEAHRLHQTFDVCEGRNNDSVNRWLGQAFAEVGLILQRITIPPPTPASDLSDDDESPTEYRLMLRTGTVTEQLAIWLKEAIHNYLTAYVLARWLDLTLPEASAVWHDRTEECRDALTSALLRLQSASQRQKSRSVTRRRVSPI